MPEIVDFLGSSLTPGPALAAKAIVASRSSESGAGGGTECYRRIQDLRRQATSALPLVPMPNEKRWA